MNETAINMVSADASAEARIATYEWKALAYELDGFSCAVLTNLTKPDESHLIVLPIRITPRQPAGRSGGDLEVCVAGLPMHCPNAHPYRRAQRHRRDYHRN